MEQKKCNLYMAYDLCFCSYQCRDNFIVSKTKNFNMMITNKKIQKIHQYQLEDWDNKNICKIM